MLDCIFVGSITKDTLIMVDEAPKSDTRILANAVLEACGGIASTSASAFNKLGGKTGLVSAIGRPSEITDFIRKNVDERRFNYVNLVEVPDKESPFSVILVEENGKRLIVHHRGSMYGLDLSIFEDEIYKDAKIIHLGGLPREFYEPAVKTLREKFSCMISVDSGNMEAEIMEAVLPYVDIFIPDDKTVKKYLGMEPMEACKYFAGRGVKYSCVTAGEIGSYAYYEGKEYFVPAIKVKVVDTTGAGDNFHGAFLYCIKEGFDMEKTLRFCNVFSGLSCEGVGGLTAQPTLEQVIGRMEK